MDQSADLITRLTTGLHGRFTVSRQVGQGGMALVFEAVDHQHDRRVAMKVLRPEIGALVGAERFSREIRIAANLNHPHILPVHASGEVGGLLYYVMPFVEGESLRDRLDRGEPLPVADALQITREVAQALGHAHAQGIVHRDLKPENIMLSSGVAVVADFGIAHVAHLAGEERLTATGLAIGTPAYMSPEQAAGDPGLDARSDIYSLGCVLYEMLAGQPPFRGGSLFAVLSQHATQEAPDVRRVRDDIPATISRAIQTALAKAPEDRFARVEDLVAACTGDTPVPWTATVAVRRIARRLRRHPRAMLGTAAVAVVLAGLGIWAAGPPSGGSSSNPVVAVLPFEHVGPPEELYLTDGLGNEISNSIAGIPGISVISRASASQFDPRTTPLAEVRRELRADYAVTGVVQTSLQPDGTTRVRLRTQLISLADERELYSDTLTRQFDAGLLFEIQSRMAQRVTDALALTLRPEVLGALQGGQTTSREAFRAYLQGNMHSTQTLVPEEQRNAIENLTQATALDPGFALAWARLAQVSANFYRLYDRSPARLALLREAVHKADSLRPNHPETAIARGYLALFADGQPDRAMAEFARARRDLPNSIPLLYGIGWAQRSRGQVDSAAASFGEAARLDPRSKWIVFENAVTIFMLRRYPEARVLLQRATQLDPSWPVPALGLANLEVHAGQLAAARAAASRVADSAVRLTPILISDPLYRPGWELAFPAPFQRALAGLTLSDPRVDTAGYYYHQGQRHRREGRPAVARAAFDSLRRYLEARRAQGGTGPWGLLDLATASLELGNRTRAGAYLDSLLATDPLAADAFRGGFAMTDAARLLVRLDRYDEAVALLDSLLRRPSSASRGLLRVDPAFEPLARHPRFQALLQGSP